MRDTSTFDLFAFKCVDWFDPKRKILKRDLPATFNGHQLIQRMFSYYKMFLNIHEKFSNAKKIADDISKKSLFWCVFGL